MPFLPFPWPINYNHASKCTKSSTHSSSSWFWSKIFFFPWIHGIAHDHILRTSSRTSEWRTTLNPLMQHPRDENLEPREAHFRFEVEPPWAWYYCISWKSYTFMMNLKLFVEIFTKLKTLPFLIFGVGHHRWLRGLIRRLPLSNKANYLIRTIWHILYFLQLWIITMA
jgi:hypothetical protein